MDPPYRKDMGQAALAAALAGGWLARKAFVVWEEAQPMQAPEGFNVQDQRRYGDTYITLMSKNHP